MELRGAQFYEEKTQGGGGRGRVGVEVQAFEEPSQSPSGRCLVYVGIHKNEQLDIRAIL